MDAAWGFPSGSFSFPGEVLCVYLVRKCSIFSITEEYILLSESTVFMKRKSETGINGFHRNKFMPGAVFLNEVRAG